MAANTQLAIVSPAYRTTHARSSFEIVEDDETLSPRSHPQTQSETPVKVGCCTCIRKRKNRKNDANTKASRKAQQKAMRARIKAFIRYTWIDTLVLFVFGIVILCLYWAPNNLRNPPVIPIWPALPRDGNTTGKLVDLRAPTEFQYPWQKSPLSDMVCAVIITTVPIVVIALFQLRIRSCWDFYAGQLGVLKAVTTTALIVSILKHYLGGFRPYFLDVCNANKTMISEYIEKHYQQIETHNFFNASICTGDKKAIKFALQSFPSGHTANSFAAATFLAFYMNAKLKVIGDHSSHYWAFVITIIPLLLASILSAEMYLTHQHHMRDIYAGLSLGLVIGTLSYRSVYAALFDARYNHIPLPPFSAKTRFSYWKVGCGASADETKESEKEVDKLVVWGWWKSGASERSKEEEAAWLQNIRSMRMVHDSEQTLPHNETDIFRVQRIEERGRAASTGQIGCLTPSFHV